MVEKIAYRISATVLLVAALAIVALLAMGLTRADAGSSAAQEQAMAANSAVAPPVEDIAAVEPIADNTDDIIDKLPLSDTFVVKRILQIDEPFVHGYYKWDDEGVPDGELVVTVDLKAESISAPAMKSGRR